MTTSTTNTEIPQRRYRFQFHSLIRQLWFQVVIGALLGIAVGILLPDVGKAVSPLNDWFIGLVKMIVVPVVFCVVSLGIASMDSLRKAGRIGVKALGYFLVLSLGSMLIGLVVANVFKPGKGMNIDVASLDASKIPGVDSGEKVGFVEFVTKVIPDSLFGAITGHSILSALLVSLLIGCALNVTKAHSAPITALM
jgi:aerobic C4-dicarboxylate transport protein